MMFKKLISTIAELTVLLTFGLFFIGYAVAIYPFEKLNYKLNPSVRKQVIKYASEM